MIKSKHFRKDVIIARVIFLVICVAVVVGIAWLVTELGKNQTDKPNTEEESSYVSEFPSSEEESSELPPETGSELESGSEDESGTEPETGTEPDTNTEPEVPKKVQINTSSSKGLNLRAEANTTCEIIISIPKGEVVEVLEEIDGWYKVKYKEHIGYVSSKYVKIVE